MTHKFYFIIALLLLPLIGRAQLNKELLRNGGFEEYAQPVAPPVNNDDDEGDEEEEEEEEAETFNPYQKPLFWYISDQLGYSRVKDAHSGEFAIKVYPNGHSFYSRDKDFNINCINIKAEGEYKLSYWYKGKAKNPNIVAIVDWYKGNKIVRKDRLSSEKVTRFTSEWQQKTITLTAPAGVDKAGIGFEIEYDASANDGGYILFDDISFMQTKEAQKEPTLTAPTAVKAQVKQREIELSWAAVSETGVTYEIRCNDKVIAKTEGTSYVVEKLTPNTSYRFTVTTIKGEETSKPSQVVSERTIQMSENADYEGRIPYLYTIREDGACPQTLRLYYNDLANPDALITYKIDGVSVTPEGSVLTFPSKGRHILQIEIEEAPERKWEIEYKLNVD
ncbi:fibronectin type III domain-containing protein [Prevotella histicola]|uniref:fibronectin type III domain-containing protein n=1 Tax=Prevotella histicola TaxID=470565 RepID=UPI0028DCBF59|nr:fibronectin type III domain-containing protein [Prevotella histicola]